ncbi:2-octaprenyl-3-methyl-6-methoxy-1,4-benzoquinol hydroxylase [Vibrio rumoiensis]|uniref:2-octaprenyl-3-methyl-6-methoxy-1,4-benzoquinol hydroxylase n=1 Tax=Vibrio rumoiensis 1S-45 TaxID=1188252 RepID=A0A1E5E392_9VIBR|nr:2-octaprenyl-3-methyl-6-methoxy-1,4-benzoquinol hydroxylase [Vibrio rumoiensis]OEF26265.1 2-octaprenyl-3-methyl-6-methoxy-1,4-benzoquinol hydroxylase [Vibrio rumoiensis 1S-45]
MSKFDVVIIGGGMVGAALAVGLAKQKKTVALIEGKAPEAFEPSQPMDLRVSAISKASVDLLTQLGAWDSIESKRVCPYLGLETWENPECRTRFHAHDLGLDKLGYMLENRLMQLGLWEQFSQYPNLTVLCPESLQHIEFGHDSNVVHLESGHTLEASWVVGADGANSKVRQQANIGITAWDYRQRCMLINVELPPLDNGALRDTTWQWFTPTGPRSFLPLAPSATGDQQGSLVWYDSPKRIKQLQGMSPEALRREVLAAFPSELGDINVLQAGSFPLTRRHAQTYFSNRCVVIGDAAHTINPLAGQGVNLGFKDVATLLDTIADKGLDSQAAFVDYQKQRRPDNLLMQSGMDFFYKTFSNDIGPLKLVRNVVLKAAEHSGDIKKKVLKYALGL